MEEVAECRLLIVSFLITAFKLCGVCEPCVLLLLFHYKAINLVHLSYLMVPMPYSDAPYPRLIPSSHFIYPFKPQQSTSPHYHDLDT